MSVYVVFLTGAAAANAALVNNSSMVTEERRLLAGSPLMSCSGMGWAGGWGFSRHPEGPRLEELQTECTTRLGVETTAVVQSHQRKTRK